MYYDVPTYFKISAVLKVIYLPSINRFFHCYKVLFQLFAKAIDIVPQKLALLLIRGL